MNRVFVTVAPSFFCSNGKPARLYRNHHETHKAVPGFLPVLLLHHHRRRVTDGIPTLQDRGDVQCTSVAWFTRRHPPSAKASGQLVGNLSIPSQYRVCHHCAWTPIGVFVSEPARYLSYSSSLLYKTLTCSSFLGPSRRPAPSSLMYSVSFSAFSSSSAIRRIGVIDPTGVESSHVTPLLDAGTRIQRGDASAFSDFRLPLRL